MLQILSPAGELQAASPVDLETTRDLYRQLIAARLYDRKATALQKQGRLATYAPYEGQEAAQIGSAAAMRSTDWMAATYRDAAAMWAHGYTWRCLFLGRTGDERGGAPPQDCRALPPSITVGGHMVHAVGLAWGARLQGKDDIAITYFGDGATSEGDFHEAMNFAGVYKSGTVFLCTNNGFAISLPRSEQTASETIAQKADAYGMPGVIVDGNDVLAVYQATRDAAKRARRGEGPTLIEALSYRIGPHTTADDPSRYRDAQETEDWLAKDPLARVKKYLISEGVWDQAWDDELWRVEGEAVEAGITEAEALDAFAPGEIIDNMFAEPTQTLEAQRADAALRAQP